MPSWVRGAMVCGAFVAATHIVGTVNAPTASAQASNCAVQVNGEPVVGGSSADDAIRVDVNDQLVLNGDSTQPGSVKVDLGFGPVRWRVYNQPGIPGPWEADVPLAKYARFGVGLYEVFVDTPTCSGVFWVKLVGRSPFSTVPGLAGLALVVIGLTAGVTSIVKAGAAGSITGLRVALCGAFAGLGANVFGQQAGFTPLTTQSIVGFMGVPGAAGYVAQRVVARLRGAPDTGVPRSEAPSGGAVTTDAPAPPSAGAAASSTGPAPLPASPSEEPAQALRFIQAQVLDAGGASHERVPLGDCRLAVRVGPGDAAWVSSPEAFPSHRLDPHDEVHTLTVTVAEPTLAPEPLVGELRLPRHGASDPCVFALHVPAGVTAVRARITVLHGNRVLQSAVLEGATTADPAGSPVRIVADALVRADVGDLKNRGEFDAAVVVDKPPEGGTQVTAVAGSSAQLLSLEGIDELVARIEERLTAVASDPEAQTGLDSPQMTELLRYLAIHGSSLRHRLITDQVAEKRLLDNEKLQVVSVSPDAFLPLEFVYEKPAPALDAPVCPAAADALRSGTCASSCPTATTAPFPVVCPLSFWCMQRVIERHASSPERVQALRGHADLALHAQPGTGRRTLDALQSGLFAFHERVDRGQAGASRGVVAALTSATAKPPVVVATWADWEAAVAEHQPTLLVLLSHTVEVEAVDQCALEIGADQQLLCAYLGPQHVTGGKTPPIVLLLGCETALNDVEFENFVSAFHRNGAAVVVGTTATVLGYHAADVASALVTALHAAVVDETVGSTFGDVLRAARRELIGKGYAMALALTAYGDADWRLAESR